MKMRSIVTVLAVATTLALGVDGAKADSKSAGKFYAGGALGLALYDDTTSTGTALSVENEFDSGYALSGVLGYYLSDGFRAEGELAYKQADIDSFTSVNAGGTSIALGSGLAGSGDVTILAGMANVAYDFDAGSGFSPYLTAGLGIAKVSVNDAKVVGVDLADDSDTVFAYQVGVGIGYEIDTGMTVDASYKYFATSDPSLTDSAGGDFDGEISTHNLMIGLRFDL